MGHVGHEGTLLDARLLGALGLLLEALLLLEQIGHVAHDAIGAGHLALLVECRETINVVPL